MRKLRCILASIVAVLATDVTLANAQAVWRQFAGVNTIILYKSINQTSFYCSWAITLNDNQIGVFDNAELALGTFRVRVRNDEAQNISEKSYIKLITDRDMWWYRVLSNHQEAVLSDVTAAFEPPLPNAIPLESGLWLAKWLRVYLPNGRYYDVDTSGFQQSIAYLNQCRMEARTLNRKS